MFFHDKYEVQLMFFIYRQCMSLFSAEKILSTNNQCTVKTEVVDNVEPTITLNLGKHKFPYYLFYVLLSSITYF